MGLSPNNPKLLSIGCVRDVCGDIVCLFLAMRKCWEVSGLELGL